MANKVLTRVWEHSQQRGAARCLIVALADVADEHGIAYPGIPYLAGMINEEEDYTYKLLRKLIEAGEVLHKPGGGRGRKTLYAVVVGLSDAQRAKANTVLQSRVYHEKPAKNPALQSRVSPLNPVPQNTVLQNGVIEGHKPCTIPDSKQLTFDASGSSGSPTDEKLILDHDPYGGGGGGSTHARFYGAPIPAETPQAPRHIAYLFAHGMESADMFAHLDPDAAIADFDARIDAGYPIGTIVNRWKKNPPAPGAIYAKPKQSRPANGHAPAASKPSERISERPTLPKGLKIAGRKPPD